MSNKTDIDDIDMLDLPEVDDINSTGAAADSSDTDERLKDLPRILRYAMLISDSARHIEPRLAAEIDQLCPKLPLNIAWSAALYVDAGLALANELDHRAVIQDQPELRSLADCVRLVSLPTSLSIDAFEDHRRVAKALLQAFYKLPRDCDDELRCDLERFCFGWAALPTCNDLIMYRSLPAAKNASMLGDRMAAARVASAQESVSLWIREQEKKASEPDEDVDKPSTGDTSTSAPVREHHLVVARIDDAQLKNTKLREVVSSLAGVTNTALPLIPVPPLHEARQTLLLEFPYAANVINAALGDLVGRTTIKFRPMLVVGEPGAGKSLFARRLGEVLSLGVWRTDASRSDGAIFGGTDKRWHSAEPCHPLLAIARAKHANPLILIDEIEKAGTRSDYGRFWDCILGFLEPETAVRYPDPALQTDVDLSQVSYLATANTIDPLPAPLRDRFRIITFPKPTADDLDALLPSVIADLARERGLDSRWAAPLDGNERIAVAAHWPGGSVRRLRRIVEAVLRERDIHATRN